jgi:hypothetical protein
MTDHPRVRASERCPLCGGPKTVGLIACWNCYNQENLRDGNALAEAIFDNAERRLSGPPPKRCGPEQPKLSSWTEYPNREFKVDELRAGDIVQLFEGPWGTGIVKTKDDDSVTFFRPYGTASEFTFTGGVICFTGTEVFSRPLPSTQTIYVYQRTNPA